MNNKLFTTLLRGFKRPFIRTCALVHACVINYLQSSSIYLTAITTMCVYKVSCLLYNVLNSNIVKKIYIKIFFRVFFFLFKFCILYKIYLDFIPSTFSLKLRCNLYPIVQPQMAPSSNMSKT